jgi:hypothetical protein
MHTATFVAVQDELGLIKTALSKADMATHAAEVVGLGILGHHELQQKKPSKKEMLGLGVLAVPPAAHLGHAAWQGAKGLMKRAGVIDKVKKAPANGAGKQRDPMAQPLVGDESDWAARTNLVSVRGGADSGRVIPTANQMKTAGLKDFAKRIYHSDKALHRTEGFAAGALTAVGGHHLGEHLKKKRKEKTASLVDGALSLFVKKSAKSPMQAQMLGDAWKAAKGRFRCKEFQ